MPFKGDVIQKQIIIQYLDRKYYIEKVEEIKVENEYVSKIVKIIQDKIDSKKDIAKIINVIYEDGFEDGFNERKMEAEND